VSIPTHELQKLASFAGTTILLACLLFQNINTSSAVVNENDNYWYAGKGLKEDTYFKYSIRYNDTNNNQPFNMTLYFSKFNDTSKQWIVPVYIELGKETRHIINGTLLLAESGLDVARIEKNATEMEMYKNVYHETLNWLAVFSSRQIPKTLADNKPWVVLAGIGASLGTDGNETITVPAGIFNTTIVIWHTTTINNKYWLNKDLPYPVKADILIPTSPTLFRHVYFELLEVGKGDPSSKITGIPEYGSSIALGIGAVSIAIVLIASRRFLLPK